MGGLSFRQHKGFLESRHFRQHKGLPIWHTLGTLGNIRKFSPRYARCTQTPAMVSNEHGRTATPNQALNTCHHHPQYRERAWRALDEEVWVQNHAHTERWRRAIVLALAAKRPQCICRMVSNEHRCSAWLGGKRDNSSITLMSEARCSLRPYNQLINLNNNK